MKRRIMAAVGISALLVVASPVQAEVAFSDVSNGFWGVEEIHFLAEQGVMLGYQDGAFGIGDDVTRAQAAVTLARLHGLDMEQPEPVSFTDVAETNYAYSGIAAAVGAGFFADGNEFRPNDTLTRAEMATILSRSSQLMSSQPVDFRDVASGHWAYESISELAENRLTTGYHDLTFRPGEPVTRAEFAVFLARAKEESFREEVAVLPQRAAENVYFPRVTGLDQASQGRVNQTLAEHAGRSVEAREELFARAEAEEDQMIAERYAFGESYRIEQNDADYLSIVFEGYHYTGGAHGGSWQTAYTFTPASGELVALKDLFPEGTDYLAIINETVSAGVTDAGFQLEFNDVFDFDGIDPDTKQFYVSDQGGTIYFSEYEIAPYAAGMPSFTISWEQFGVKK
ncbi:S-layer homology domain-containing protein [Alkalihalobacillus oceani]|uniref:S-layer homology domain-containing protein n=1 Tax=Halalkalibacter oceani TaxID=1653776 RepID=A0A9X2DTT3_9BACI|nr:S-layer homology domain-containing protein [Halalkalibacter oceani]MCM3716297.1 S-layer homology domain-containing protein [Halalkalibacter oceani]